MNQAHCLYCGSEYIVPVDEANYQKQNLHILQCQRCKVMFTELEQRLEADTTPLDYKPKFDVSDEEATLDAIWDQWDQARTKWSKSRSYNLELLFQHKYPLKHPVEFMIYRSLWQEVDASFVFRILTPDENYDHRYACEHLLAMLTNNLKQLEYFLPSYTEEERLHAMQRIYKAINNLRSRYIYVRKVTGDKKEFTDSIDKHRLIAVFALINALEKMYDAGHGLEYLKMAGRLCQKCLGIQTLLLTSYERDYGEHSFTIEDKIRMPEDRLKYITEKANELKSTIHKTEPNFSMSEPIAWKKFLPFIYGFLGLSLCFGVVFAHMAYISSYISNKYGPNTTVIHDDPIPVISGFMIFPIMGLIIFATVVLIIFTVYKRTPGLYADKRKRKEIYERLYAKEIEADKAKKKEDAI